MRRVVIESDACHRGTAAIFTPDGHGGISIRRLSCRAILPAQRLTASVRPELLAHQPNVVVKFSGLGIRGRRWTAELQRPVLPIAYFGEEGAMFVCNDPIDSHIARLDEINGSFPEVTGKLSEAEPVLARQRRKHQ